MQVCTFIDLDDTLFQTLPKCPPDEPRRAVGFGKDGTALSYMTARQERLFELLGSLGTVIPVTARNLDAFRRVDLRFSSLAILDFGGIVLLPDGSLDAAWDATIRPQALASQALLEATREAIATFSGQHDLGVRARVISDFDMPLYVVVKHPAGDVSALERIVHACLPSLKLDSCFIHANGNNLSIVPRFLGKEHAVRYVLEHHVADALTIGVGDSLSDIPFLRSCDFFMTPRASQLSKSLIP